MEVLRVLLANLSGPEPLPTKVRLALRNTAYKLRHHTHCCGHPGEPGC
jgi:hypothetical protein